MKIDKTYSELWNIVEHKDNEVRETAKMAINALQKLQDENEKLCTVIETNRNKKILDFVNYLVIDVKNNYPKTSTDEAYKIVFNSMKNSRTGILHDALHLVETDRIDFDN